MSGRSQRGTVQVGGCSRSTEVQSRVFQTKVQVLSPTEVLVRGLGVGVVSNLPGRHQMWIGEGFLQKRVSPLPLCARPLSYPQVTLDH